MKFNQLIDRSNVLYKYNSIAFDINTKLKTKLEIKLRPDLTYLEYRFKNKYGNVAIIEIDTTVKNTPILSIKCNGLIEMIMLKHIVNIDTIYQTIQMILNMPYEIKQNIKLNYYQHCKR